MKYSSFRDFFRQELILCIAAVLAVLSCIVVPPDCVYLKYIDYRTLALLFSLMAVMAGLGRQGVFSLLGRRLLSKTGSVRQLVLVLVLLCFFSSMLITNDVALITFVPFTFVVLEFFGPALRRQLAPSIVCMQTVAANLGSMFTPIGNPQNLYLYGKCGFSMSAFLRLMLPYTAVSLLLIIAWAFIVCRKSKGAGYSHAELCIADEVVPDKKKLLLYAVLFMLCLLTVARVLPYQALLPVVLAVLLIFDRRTLRGVDYSLLLTFAAFFVFIGNLGRVDGFSGWLSSILTGREVPIAVMASQVISNVPAALMLSGFTEQTAALIIGTNLGGLGTLIASMASLISFRQIARQEPERKGRYFILFTASNIVFLAVLLGLWLLIK